MSNTSSSESAHPRPAAASLWRFGPEDAPVLVRNAEAVLAHLPLFLGGWPLRWVGEAETPDTTPDIEIVERAEGAIDVATAAHRAEYAGAMDAANALAGALIGAFIGRRSAMICLHAGSALIGGGLVALIGGSHAGKSSVALQLAAAGYRLFGDDRIALDLADMTAPLGLCLGLMPKIRLPLPPDAGPRLAEFVDAYSELQDEAAAYLKPWAGEAATFGETASLRALVVLERSEGAPARLDPLARPALLRTLIESVTAPGLDAGALVAQLDALARAVPAYALSFGASREAAALLARSLTRASGDG
jgi:hypothetical protein